ncbi:hereditary hemochromatosis protein homolog [Brienomyrus brachyistius]|uniref:hereditary hemochromatosis protein homolog n=1 Tax=Brienomyrus brachyistius TaxID=42636 RepID=UPI0020B3D1D3|nr:hereditary hemochromatosis protein homolog [Brienomyrus brachyistius]
MEFTQTCFIHIFLAFLIKLTGAEGIVTIKANKGQKILLPCNVSEDSLNKTYTVNWRKNGTSPALCYYRVSQNGATKNWKCGSRYVTEGRPPRLYLTNVSFSDSGVYNCSVERQIPPPNKEKIYLVDLLVGDAARPTVSVSRVEGPSGNPALLCSVRDFYPESIEQDWLRDGLPLNVTPDRRSTVNPDGSYSLDSYLSLTPAHAEDVLCSCWVNHSSLDLPLNYTFQCKEHKTAGVAVPILCGIFCVMIIFLVFILFKKFKAVLRCSSGSIHTPPNNVQESLSNSIYSNLWEHQANATYNT